MTRALGQSWQAPSDSPKSAPRALDVLEPTAVGEVRVRAAFADGLVGAHGEALWAAVTQPVGNEAVRVDSGWEVFAVGETVHREGHPVG
jgi:hypothetical protein